MTTRATSSDQDAASIPKGLVAMTGFSVILATLTLTLPVTVLDQISESFGTSGGLLNWVVIMGSLSGAIGTGLLPPLASIFGQRTMTVVTMALLTVGSLIGVVAQNMLVVLIGRFIGGFALGAIALSLAIIRANLAGRKLSVVLSWIAAAEGIAAGLGFVLGGLLTDMVNLSWRAVFGTLAVLGIVGIFGALKTIPHKFESERRRVDWLGGLLLAVALTLILVPLSMGPHWGWGTASVVLPLVAAVVVVAIWWVVEDRTEQPLVNTRALRNTNFLRGWLMFFLAGMLAWIMNFTIPKFTGVPSHFGFGFGYNSLVSGLLMLVFCGGIVVGSSSAGRLSRIIQPRIMCLMSFTGCAVGMLLLVFLHNAAWQLWLWPLIIGLSYGLTAASAYLTFINAIEAEEGATAASIGQISGPLGGAVGSAGITAVLTAQVITVGASAVPTERSFELGWLIGAGIAVVGFLLVVFIRPVRSSTGVESSGAWSVHPSTMERSM